MSYIPTHFTWPELLSEITYRELELIKRLDRCALLLDDRILITADRLRQRYGKLVAKSSLSAGSTTTSRASGHPIARCVCLGCAKQCALVSPEGFELVLPVSLKKRVKSCFAYLPQVSAQQLLESKLLLRVDEAAFVLNISESEVRNYVDEGRLAAHPEPPLRVTAESLKSNILL
ncbi:MAG: hypothetical protein R6W92_03445 [Desulfocurvibacter africanus]